MISLILMSDHVFSKHIYSVLSVIAIFITITSCRTQDSWNDYIFEYSGTIESLFGEMADSQGFYIGFAVYSDGSCLLYTALTAADNTLNEYKLKKCSIEYDSKGITLYEKESNLLIARGSFTGEMLMSDLLLTWDSPVCEIWEKYADQYGWALPCRMILKTYNVDDIRY